MEWADKENRIAVIALHKCRIERAHIFELLKPMFLCIILLLFLDTGGGCGRKRSGRPRMVHTPQVNNTVRSRNTEILCENKKSWLRKWILHQEP